MSQKNKIYRDRSKNIDIIDSRFGKGKESFGYRLAKNLILRTFAQQIFKYKWFT